MPSRAEPSYYSRQVTRALRFNLAERTARVVGLESGGREECPRQYDIERTVFPCSVLEFIARGKAHIQLGRETWELGPGSIYTYHRSLPHRLRCAAPGGMTKYFLCFSESGPGRRLFRRSPAPGRVARVSDTARIAEIFEDLICLGRQPGRHQACLTTFDYLLLKIEELTISHDRLASGSYGTYLHCLEFMKEHFLACPSVEKLAAACQINAAYLSRLFQRFGGKTPYEQLLDFRMAYAARKLRDTGTPVRELSEELSFADPAVFSRAFKKHLGVAPSFYR